MFSPEAFKQWEEKTNSQRLLAEFWEQLATQFNLQAILIVRFDRQKADVEVVSTYGVPAEPFNGSEKEWLVAALKDCFKFAKPHVHSIGHLAFANIIKRFSQKLHGTHRVWFIPTEAYGLHFIFLGFPQPDWKGKEIPPELFASLDKALFVQARVMQTAMTAERLEVTELFVKEMETMYLARCKRYSRKLTPSHKAASLATRRRRKHQRSKRRFSMFSAWPNFWGPPSTLIIKFRIRMIMT